jgi:hypothetical protein
MKQIHRPTAVQSVVLTFRRSTSVPDPSAVISAVFVLSDSEGHETQLSATRLSATETDVTFQHVWDPETGEAQEFGQYAIWGLLALADGPIATNPYFFEVIENNKIAR